MEKPKEAFAKPKEAEKQEDQDKEEALEFQFKLSDDQKTGVVDTVVEMLEEATAARAGWLAIREESIRQYEGVKAVSNDPWPGHSNISTMVTTVACDLLHAKLFPMAWNPQSLNWEGVEEHDLETSEVNGTVMAWVSSVDMKLQDKVDDVVHGLVVDGTIGVKYIWEPYWTYVTRKIPKITFQTFETGKFDYDVKVDYIRRERCKLDHRPIERVYIPYYSDTSVPRWEDEAEYILDERWYTLAELREKQAKGQIEKSVNLDDLIQKMDELSEFTGTSKERMSAEGTTAPPTPTVRKEAFKLRCIEGYIKYAFDKNDPIRKQCVFLVVVQPKFYLSGMALHHVSRIGRRPWLIRPFLRRPGRVYGKGVPEVVRHLHTLMDAIHNQRVDAGNRVIGGGGFYRPASGTNPRRLKVGPATWIPVDDPKNDVYMPTYNVSGLQWSWQEEKMVMEMIERLTYLTPAMLGRESASRPTARGTLAVIQQGESKFSLIGSRVQGIICDILTDIRQKYEENMPPAKWERIMGQKRLRDWPSPEYMAGMYEAKMQLDLTALDYEGKRALAVGMYQMMAFDPLVTQNPAFMWEVRADLLRAFRKEPVEKFIGPRPPTTLDESSIDDVFTMIEQETKPDIAKLDASTVLPRLMELKRSERYENFTPEAKALFNDTVRKLQMGYIEKIEKGMAQYAEIGPFGAGGSGQAAGLGAPAGPLSGAMGPGQVNAGGAGVQAG
jgi:hypothetical protein